MHILCRDKSDPSRDSSQPHVRAHATPVAATIVTSDYPLPLTPRCSVCHIRPFYPAQLHHLITHRATTSMSTVLKQTIGRTYLLHSSFSGARALSGKSGHSIDDIQKGFKGYFVHKNLMGLNPKLKPVGDLKGKTVFVSGGSRGIGLAIAVRAAQDGANVVIAAKTAEPHPNLPGTIFTAAAACEAAGAEKAMAIQMDLRDEASVESAFKMAAEEFGGIDILVNNASAIHIEPSETVDMKRYDLMHGINGRGTFLASKLAIPYLKKGNNAHILNLSPPLDSTLGNPIWFKLTGTAYITAKLSMSLQVLGLSAELRQNGIGVNGLWPRTTIATAAVQNMLGGDDMMDRSRTPEIMGDAAHAIFCSDAKRNTGQFWVDDEVMVGTGTHDLKKYRVNPEIEEHELIPDFFV